MFFIIFLNEGRIIKGNAEETPPLVTDYCYSLLTDTAEQFPANANGKNGACDRQGSSYSRSEHSSDSRNNSSVINRHFSTLK
jgi:hypothetical protein